MTMRHCVTSVLTLEVAVYNGDLGIVHRRRETEGQIIWGPYYCTDIDINFGMQGYTARSKAIELGSWGVYMF